MIIFTPEQKGIVEKLLHSPNFPNEYTLDDRFVAYLCEALRCDFKYDIDNLRMALNHLEEIILSNGKPNVECLEGAMKTYNEHHEENIKLVGYFIEVVKWCNNDLSDGVKEWGVDKVHHP